MFVAISVNVVVAVEGAPKLGPKVIIGVVDVDVFLIVVELGTCGFSTVEVAGLS
ncbi:hypothetical protein J9174_11245 [Macrococcoides canis]|uniref:hypothetical protein n=1 Tax=Macrococcoides canis TaxID=1855823 RepID=UPI0019332572|nr:hypothetical protein [Macrococcus canis]QTQ07945.1 hypothetical protein J9174_11245 [Macrococcus canis]UTH02245.1 hypothetical protein KFV05_11290 [Macrococcus canis]